MWAYVELRISSGGDARYDLNAVMIAGVEVPVRKRRQDNGIRACRVDIARLHLGRNRLQARIMSMAPLPRALKDPRARLKYDTGHTWIHLQSADLVAIGATGFAVGFLGRPATLRLPRESSSLGLREVAWTLVSARGRRLRQVTAIPGKVVAVNADLLRDPGLLQRSPCDRAWILCIKPSDTSASMRGLLSYESYLTLLDRSRSILSAHLDAGCSVALGRDVWPTAFGDRISATDWKVLRSRLFLEDVRVGQWQSSQLRAGNSAPLV